MISNDEFERVLSAERFARYLEWAGGGHDRARDLYTLNTRISEALYTPLQMLEVALRNRIQAVMSASVGERWFESGILSIEHQRRQLASAIADIQKDQKAPTAGRIIAALTLSFWTAMLSPAYEKLWQVSLHCIARRDNGKGVRRQDMAGDLNPIRTLRNRIAHHEPIIEWNLPRHYGNILRLTEWLSPAAAQWSRTNSRFEQVHPKQRIELLSPHPASPHDNTGIHNGDSA